MQLVKVNTGTVVLKFKKKGVLFIQGRALFLARDQFKTLQMCFTSEMLHVVTSWLHTINTFSFVLAFQVKCTILALRLKHQMRWFILEH